MYSSVIGLALLATLIVFVLLAISFDIYFAIKKQNDDKKKAPWTAVILYVLCILVDWYYAYSTQQLYGASTCAWFVIFPLFSYFYLTFSVIALSGIYHLKKWGFGLGYITILAGLIAYANTALIVYDEFPLMPEFFTLILLLNFIIIIYMAVYASWNKLNGDA
jgi:heme A synthase